MHTIARALPEDAETMLEIQRRAFAEEGRRCESQQIPPLAESLAAILEHIERETALKACIDGQVVAAIRGIVVDGVCTVRALVVEPAHQGRRIGSSLLKALEESLPRVTRFDLTTNTVMESNVPFYERHGYHVVELTPYSEKITLAQMTKAVAGDA